MARSRRHFYEYVRGITFLAVLLLAIGCIDPSLDKSQIQPGAPDSSPGEGIGTHPMFPHPDDWETPDSHGDWVIEFGATDSCLSCHKVVSAQEETPPTCHSCHSLYPHKSDWIQGESHGNAVLSMGQDSCATQCHGSDLQGGLSGLSCNACHALFPHNTSFGSSTEHGEIAKGSGKALCKGCHGDDLQGGSSGVSCYQCHLLYPHESGWISRESHGRTVLNKGQSVCATQCHGSDLRGGLSGIACNRCHVLYPHTSTWENPEEHGEVSEGDGKELCKGCHGDDLQGGSSGIGCKSCHALYPHIIVWAQAAQHGYYVRRNGVSACSTQCHGLDLQGGLSEIACESCHDLYPHTDTWEEDHGAEAILLGNDACQDCHGLDFKRFLDGRNCFSCHADYPHPDPSIWLPYNGHGKKIRATYGRSTATCESCHGSDLREIKEGQNCFSCHPSFPHQDPIGYEWRDYEGHGEYTMLNSRTECELCHGAYYRGGIRRNSSCFSCHVSYPHFEEWLRPSGEPQGHGVYVLANTSASCATARCHGEGLVPVPGFSQGPSCNGCHVSYPHSADWDSGVNHGPPARADIDNCKPCHGSTLNIARPGSQSCEECHASYLRHATAELGFVGWGTYTGHGLYVRRPPLSGDMTECQLCHGDDYRGGISRISCKSSACHGSYPHNESNWPEDDGHGNYVQTVLRGDLTECKSCHASDLTGGRSGQSCFSCHPDYPHASTWRWGSSHGPSAYGSGKDACGTAGCHGTDFLGGDYAPSCYACHPYFPHTDPDWGAVTGPTNAHADTFIQKVMKRIAPLACLRCHGERYAREIEGTSCISCHTGGVTHQPDWPEGTGHGIYYSNFFDARSTTFCQDCHREPIPFTWLQTKEELEAQSDCYSCHWTYPHTSYDTLSPRDDVLEWHLSSGAVHLQGHAVYLFGSPLVTDTADPPNGIMGLDDPELVIPAAPGVIPILQNTCGGLTTNNCHFDGYRSGGPDFGFLLCSGYCHNP